MAYERSVDVPIDVLYLDGRNYMIPGGLEIKVEPLIKAGVKKIQLSYRNVSLVPYEGQKKMTSKVTDMKSDIVDAHPLFPVDEVLVIPANNTVVLYSKKLFETMNITFEGLLSMYAENNPWIREIDPSQLSFGNGKLQIGEASNEALKVVWDGREFYAMPLLSPVPDGCEAVVEVNGAVIEDRLRCKYGMLRIKR